MSLAVCHDILGHLNNGELYFTHIVAVATSHGATWGSKTLQHIDFKGLESKHQPSEY